MIFAAFFLDFFVFPFFLSKERVGELDHKCFVVRFEGVAVVSVTCGEAPIVKDLFDIRFSRVVGIVMIGFAIDADIFFLKLKLFVNGSCVDGMLGNG